MKRGLRMLTFTLFSLLLILMVFRPLLLRLTYTGDQYVYLASHFARGDLTVDNLPVDYQDFVPWQGHKYLPLGPLPALALIPFLPLLEAGLGRDMATIGQLFTLLNVWLLAKVLARAGVTGERRNWALLLFFGGTVYFSMAVEGTSWFFAHILATTCLLLAMAEALGKRRALLIGLFLGLSAMTRLTTIFALPFFLWLLWRNRPHEAGGSESQRATASRFGFAGGTLLMAVGLAGPLLLLGLYNYARFGSPLESGYGHALLGSPVLTEALRHGLFSLEHVPKNLFMMLLQGPAPYPGENAPVLSFPYMQPSLWGMGLFFTSPALVHAFFAKRKDALVQACLLGILSVMLPVITYYGVGWAQFGFRYALDFMPFLIVLVARGFPDPMTDRARALVLASMAINLWGTLFLTNWLIVWR